MVLQQAMMDVGLPIDMADNQPLIEAPPPVLDQVMRGGYVIDFGCEVCLAGVPKTNVFIPCGHVFCGDCANRIEIWPGTNETCHVEGRCFVCRTPVQINNRVFL